MQEQGGLQQRNSMEVKGLRCSPELISADLFGAVSSGSEAGRCDYQADDWQIQEQKGLCVKPMDFSPDAKLDISRLNMVVSLFFIHSLWLLKVQHL